MTTVQIVKIHKVLSDKTRFEIFDMIWQNPNISGKELLAEFNVTQPTLSFHITKLENARLIEVKKIGQTHHYSVNKSIIQGLLDYCNKCMITNKNK